MIVPISYCIIIHLSRVFAKVFIFSAFLIKMLLKRQNNLFVLTRKTACRKVVKCAKMNIYSVYAQKTNVYSEVVNRSTRKNGIPIDFLSKMWYNQCKSEETFWRNDYGLRKKRY